MKTKTVLTTLLGFLLLSIPFSAFADNFYGGCVYGNGTYDQNCPDAGSGGGGGGGVSSGSGGGGGGSIFVTPTSTSTVTVATTSAVVNPILHHTTNVAASSFAFAHDLKLGMTDPDVELLQQFLNSDGFIVAQTGIGSPGKETTYFGSLTQIALAAFQKANNISPASGYFGPLTRSVVNGLLGAPASSTPQVAATPVQTSIRNLSLGMSGTDVSGLQTFLISQTDVYPNGTVTGYFGALTEQAVGNFQFKYGIIHSANDDGYGIVGPKTRTKINAVQAAR